MEKDKRSYYAVDSFARDRLPALKGEYDGLSLRLTIAAIEKEERRISREMSDAIRAYEVMLNDLRLYMSQRRGKPTPQDRTAAIAAVRDRVQREEDVKSAKAGNMARIRREKRVVKVAENALDIIRGDDIKGFRASGADYNRAVVVVLLDSIVQVGLASVDYRNHAAKAGLTVDQINKDVETGRALRYHVNRN